MLRRVVKSRILCLRVSPKVRRKFWGARHSNTNINALLPRPANMMMSKAGRIGENERNISEVQVLRNSAVLRKYPPKSPQMSQLTLKNKTA